MKLIPNYERLTCLICHRPLTIDTRSEVKMGGCNKCYPKYDTPLSDDVEGMGCGEKPILSSPLKMHSTSATQFFKTRKRGKKENDTNKK